MAETKTRPAVTREAARQRRVIRVAIMYAMIGFAVAQIGGLVLIMLGYPEGWGSFLGLVVVTGFPMALLLAWFNEPSPPPASPGAEATRAPSLPTPAPRAPWSPRPAAQGIPVASVSGPVEIHSLAVLPFTDASPAKDQAFLGAGLADELIDALSRVPGLHVSARDSSFGFMGEELQVSDIGQILNVSVVLEGTVQRTDERLVVTARLVDSRSGVSLWSESYDRPSGDLYEVEGEIAGGVARALRVAADGDPNPWPSARSANPDVHLLALRAAHLNARYAPEECKQALALYMEAAGRDPFFARAWTGVAESYLRLVHLDSLPARDALPLARPAATRAAELAPDLAEVHVVLGEIAMIERGFERAEREYRRAIELSPLSAAARARYAALLMATARVEEAVEHARLAVELDPLSVGPVYSYALVYAQLGRYRVALELLEKAARLAPDSPQVYWSLIGVLGDVGRQHDAVEAARELHAKMKSRWSAARLGAALLRAGQKDEGAAVVRSFEGPRAQRLPGRVSPQEIVADVWLGHPGDAFRALEGAIERSEPFVAHIATDIDFDPVRNDPRWEPLLTRAGFHDDMRRRARALYEQRIARAKAGDG